MLKPPDFRVAMLGPVRADIMVVETCIWWILVTYVSVNWVHLHIVEDIAYKLLKKRHCGIGTFFFVGVINV